MRQGKACPPHRDYNLLEVGCLIDRGLYSGLLEGHQVPEVLTPGEVEALEFCPALLMPSSHLLTPSSPAHTQIHLPLESPGPPVGALILPSE